MQLINLIKRLRNKTTMDILKNASYIINQSIFSNKLNELDNNKFVALYTTI